MQKEAMKVFASLINLDGKTIEKMTKTELKELLRTFMNELDFVVQTVSQQAPNINPKYDITVSTSLALAPLVCLVDKYIQVIVPEVARAYRGVAMEYLHRLADNGLIQMEEPREVVCTSCGHAILIHEPMNDKEQLRLCLPCAKRVNTKSDMKVKQ